MPPDITVHDRIRQSAIGTGLDDQHINALAAIAALAGYAAGQTVFTEGSAAQSVSVVCSGSVALEVHVPLRGSVRILTLGPGDLLGWSGISGDGLMTSSATALEDTELLNLPTTSLRRLCDGDHTLGYAVMNLVARSLAKRLQGTRLQMLDLFSETQPTPAPSSGSMDR